MQCFKSRDRTADGLFTSSQAEARLLTTLRKSFGPHMQAANGDTNVLLASIRKKATNLDAFAATQGTLPRSGAAEYPTFRARNRSTKRVARAQATQAFVAKIKSDLQEAQAMLEVCHL